MLPNGPQSPPRWSGDRLVQLGAGENSLQTLGSQQGPGPKKTNSQTIKSSLRKRFLADAALQAEIDQNEADSDAAEADLQAAIDANAAADQSEADATVAADLALQADWFFQAQGQGIEQEQQQ